MAVLQHQLVADNPEEEQAMQAQAWLAAALASWYAQHQRALPWRNTTDAYHIYLSEVILQQTRVQQGLPYYQAFVQAFPTVQHLAAASQQQVLKLWQGLGYYSRARNLHATAQQVMAQHGGQFPACHSQLLQLKGVGPYTAAAVASFAANEAVAVVDGNVQRVLARVFGLGTAVDSSRGRKLFQAVAQAQLPAGASSQHNQAIMEFGALQCTPRSPQCSTCPLQARCVAHARGLVALLPHKGAKTKVQAEHLSYYLIADPQGHTLWRQRGAASYWQGLWEPVLVQQPWALAGQVQWPALGLGPQQAQVLGHHSTTHVLSHRKLYVQLFRLQVQAAWKGMPQGYAWLAPSQVLALPMPVVLHRLCMACGFAA